VITEHIPLPAPAPGLQVQVTVLRFGQPGRGPKAYVQAALHADEIPALLVAQKLRSLLLAEEAQGHVAGEVVLVPYANPLGLAQHPLGQHLGRFDLRDGVNFNRLVPDVTPAAVLSLEGQLVAGDAGNEARVRRALREAAAARSSSEPAAELKNRLLELAVDAQIVLDLHCDAQAVMHLYALTPQADLAADLGARLGAHAILLATESGDSPFDEACTRTWLQLQERFPRAGLPLGCFGVTLELRGTAETDHALAEHDAAALIEFLRGQGVLAGAPAPRPAPLCEPTALASSEPLTAPTAGVVVFHKAPGERVQAGERVADVVDIDTGQTSAVHAQSTGVLYARIDSRWASAGKRLAKIAGTTLARTGKLLGA
jgi:hypothetical protein